MKYSFFVLNFCYLWSAIHAQFPHSPCPGIFSYEGSEPENDHWYGVILVSTDEALVGVRLDIRFDRPAQLLVSWMGEVTSSNNERFTILSLTQKLLPGPPLSSRFMVKYDPARGSPQLRSIRLNGRQICPPDPNFPIRPQSRPQVIEEKSTRRPDPSFGYNMGERVPSESIQPVIFDHQTSTTTRVYAFTESSNQYKPARPQNPSNNYHETGEIGNNFNIRTTRRPNEGNNYNYQNNFNTGINSGNNNFYETTTYKKTQGTTTTESYNYNNQGRPNHNNNNNDNYYNTPTTKKPNTYNSNKTHISTTDSEEDSYSTSHNNGNNNNNNSNKNKNQSKPSSQNQPSSSTSSNNNDYGYNTNTKYSTQKTTTTTKRTTQKPQMSQSSDYAGHRVNPTKNTSQNSGNSYQSNGGRITTPKYQNSKEVLDTSSSNSYQCGVITEDIKTSTASPIPLITNGQQTSRGQWPWHIALYKIDGINLSYICGGTLVSLKAVITAAHCVTKKVLDRPVDPDTLVVYLGKYHLYQFSDDGGVQNKQVKDVHIYPGYNSSNFLGDIAVLILSSSVEYTTFVRPCCLWRFSTSVVGKEGTVVGWGYDENDRVTEELKMAKMPVVSHETCIYSYPEFFTRFTSPQTFCAGFRRGTTVCNGDSGGGMVFNQDSKWYLKGLVSITVAREGLKVCDTNHYVIFTDVAEFLDWLDPYIT